MQWSKTPDHWKQDDWTNVIVSENMQIDTSEYEEGHLYKAWTNKFIEKADDKEDDLPIPLGSKGIRKKALAKAKIDMERKLGEIDIKSKSAK